jgi:hypothetical protein
MLKRSSIFVLAAIAMISAATLSVVVSAAALSVTSVSAKPYQIFRAPQGNAIPAGLI